METRHESVLFDEAIQNLAVKKSDIVVDATLGGAGHFRALLSSLDRSGTIIGIDADQDAIARAQIVVNENKKEVRTVLAHDNFRNLGTILDNAGIERVDKVLFDLGWSSFHLTSGRGFSFRTSEPLLMTYGSPEEGETAASLINGAPEETLVDIFFTYGEERFARAIARAIVAARRIQPILTTDELATIVAESTPAWYQHRRIHPATKVFQALRIAVNDELGALREGLDTALTRLEKGGRIAVITFHSIEDRIVKTTFRDAAHDGAGMLVTKKPIVPSTAEMLRNPRARSAKLRVFEACRLPQSSHSSVSSITHSSFSYL